MNLARELGRLRLSVAAYTCAPSRYGRDQGDERGRRLPPPPPCPFRRRRASAPPLGGAIRMEGQAQFHPRKYLLGLAKTIPGGGSAIFEQTLRPRPHRRRVGLGEDEGRHGPPTTWCIATRARMSSACTVRLNVLASVLDDPAAASFICGRDVDAVAPSPGSSSCSSRACAPGRAGRRYPPVLSGSRTIRRRALSRSRSGTAG